jgi:branched-chain amino acid transport system substrate-binding protein
MGKSTVTGHTTLGVRALAALLLLGSGGWTALAATPGVSDKTIRVGGVMDLQGLSRGLGQGMQRGLQAAFGGARVQGRAIKLVVMNDNYSPPRTVEATNKLVQQGVFAMVGNVGTPTAKVSLPILAEHHVPAVGFFTGAGILRPGVGDIINFRASYVQETAAVINAALRAGIKPNEVCAYVQNDAYGMAGVEGIRRALTPHEGMDEILASLDEVMSMEGDDPPRNNIGPVGVYKRNTLFARDGYLSLKDWERSTGVDCRLVVTVGTYAAIAEFAAYARTKGEHWLVSAVSFTGAENFRSALQRLGVSGGVIMTQVVPPLNSDLPIVAQARKALGDGFGYVSLEGYIVGKLFLNAMDRIKGPLTRESFLDALRGRRLDLGGLHLDFADDNQGSDLVTLTYLDHVGYHLMQPRDWQAALGE